MCFRSWTMRAPRSASTDRALRRTPSGSTGTASGSPVKRLALLPACVALGLLAGPAHASDLLARIETEVQSIASTLSQSVVTVRAVRLDGQNGEVKEVYIGTGVVFDSGWVVTTPSVVARGVRYSVQAAGEVPVLAELVGFDLEGQTAVFRAPTLHLPPARFRPDSILVPGRILVVLGNAYGLETAAGLGVAAGSREDGLWQVGVNVAPGASGSPVANTRGEVVGLVVAALSGTDSPANTPAFGGSVAVVIPASRVYSLAMRMRTEGSPGRAFLGIRPQSVEAGLSKALGLSRGVLIGAVSFGSPADASGLRPGDVIVEMDNRPMRHEEDLRRILAEHCPGEEVDISLVRQRALHNVRVTLGQLPELLPDRPSSPPALSMEAPVGAARREAGDVDLLGRIRLLEEQLAELQRRLDDR